MNGAPNTGVWTKGHSAHLLSTFQTKLIQELGRRTILALLGAILLNAVSLCLIALSSNSLNKSFGVAWILIAIMVGTVLVFLTRVRTLRQLGKLTLLGMLLLLIWFMALRTLVPLTPEFFFLAQVALLLGVAPIPLATRFSIPWSVVFLLAGAFPPTNFQISVAAPIFCIGILWIMVRQMALTRLSIAAHVSHEMLGRYCESSTAEAQSIVRLLGAGLGSLVDSNHCLMIYGTNRSEIITSEHGIQNSLTDPVYVQGIQQRVSDTGLEQGLLSTKELGAQFREPLKNWFRAVPANIFFARLIAVLGDSEQRIIVLLPLKRGARLSGMKRFSEALLSLVAVAKVALLASRGRFLSSDVLLFSQRSISEREEELNQLVHLVNNVAQDMAIQCEEVRGILSNGASVEDRKSDLSDLVQDLESASRSLSLGVSDVKLFQELSNLRSFNRSELVAVPLLVEEVGSYAGYRAKRRGDVFHQKGEIDPELQVSAISREYLETVLRLLLREAGTPDTNKAQGKLESSLEVNATDASVVFSVVGNGGKIEETTIKEFEQQNDDNQASDQRVTMLKAVERFAKMSGGEFKVTLNGLLSFKVTLPRGATAQVVSRGRNQWALFVDDNPHVTTFYGRVAQALNLEFDTAASVDQAQSILRSKGRPNLVITDIQLGEGSGLDLVEHLRNNFGKTLPIIVVSGNPEENVRFRAVQAGATRFLAKPVGRARLFGEIEQLMGVK